MPQVQVEADRNRSWRKSRPIDGRARIPVPLLGHWRFEAMSLSVRSTAGAIAAVRFAAGIALSGAPSMFLRLEPSVVEGGSAELLMRTVGIRDLAIGSGTAAALVVGTNADLQRWIAAGLLSDLLDVAAGIAAARRTGWRGYLSAAIAAPMLPLGVAALFGARREATGRRA
jgi:hypothetical protein